LVTISIDNHLMANLLELEVKRRRSYLSDCASSISILLSESDCKFKVSHFSRIYRTGDNKEVQNPSVKYNIYAGYRISPAAAYNYYSESLCLVYVSLV
jgi:hypothetical protein